MQLIINIKVYDMFDKIDIEATVPDYIQEVFETDRLSKDIMFGDIAFVPVKCLITRTIKYYQAKVENLLITYKHRNSIIRVTNSIHKFAKGNNYSEMSFKELCQALNRIVEITGIRLEQWKLKKMEIAFNIETERKGTEYLALFSTFKNKIPDKMRKDAYWYGIKWFFSEYQLKIYDKTEEVKRHDKISLDANILRFEIVIAKMRKIPVVSLLSDLQSEEKLTLLFDFFISEIEKIKTIETVDFSQVSKERDIEMFFASQNESYWQTQKEINPDKVKEKRRRYNRILDMVSNRDTMNTFLERLQQKFLQFISS